MASLFKPPEFSMPAEGFQGGSIAQAHSSPRVTLGDTTPHAVNSCDIPLGVKQVGKQSLSGNAELLVFDILNIFRWHWFLLTNQLETHIFLAQKAKDRKIFWVEFSPQFHTHLVKCAVALVPHPIQKVKKVMFVYLLELLNGQGHQAFFDLAKGTRIATRPTRRRSDLHGGGTTHQGGSTKKLPKRLPKVPHNGNASSVDASSHLAKLQSVTDVLSPKR
jgi:hypothetical protein